jgi:hypothetical protein
MKASSKVETMVPSYYYGFIYQMKAYSAMIGIITGAKSFVLVQLENLVHSIKKYAACYKLEIAQDKPSQGNSKMSWTLKSTSSSKSAGSLWTEKT